MVVASHHGSTNKSGRVRGRCRVRVRVTVRVMG